MSRIFCVIDGMTDPVFHADDYPHLRRMRFEGCFQNTPDFLPTETLNCNLNMLGVSNIPQNIRGYAEAVGAGMEVGEGDLAFRVSWYALDNEGRCAFPQEAPEEIALKNARYKKLGGYRASLVIPGKAQLLDGMLTKAPYKTVGRHFSDFAPKGCDELESFFIKECENACCPIFWAQSVKTKIAPFGMRAAVICGNDTIRGIARLLKMTLIDVREATGDTDTDLSAKVEAAIKASVDYPFVLLHINGADEASHRLDGEEKRRFLRRVDEEAVKRLISCGCEIVLTSDHGTDPINGYHIGLPQPYFTSGIPYGLKSGTERPSGKAPALCGLL